MTINTKYIFLLAALLLPVSAFAQTATATFDVYKNWDQDNWSGDLDEVEVPLLISCTSGSIPENTANVTDDDKVTFLVHNLPDNTHNCTVTETVPDNYTASYYNDDTDETTTDGCVWENVSVDGDYECVITNIPDEAVITVNKTWIIEGGDAGFDGDYKIKVKCDGSGSWVGLYDTDNGDYHTWDWCGGSKCGAGVKSNADEGDSWFEFTVGRPAYGGQCWVEESFDDSVIESDNSCDESFDVDAGDEIECDIVNTVFFEGIPTLSQYGMAILALLMLSIGFVGFRRFV